VTIGDIVGDGLAVGKAVGMTEYLGDTVGVGDGLSFEAFGFAFVVDAADVAVFVTRAALLVFW
jgi:hypothetical protein